MFRISSKKKIKKILISLILHFGYLSSVIHKDVRFLTASFKISCAFKCVTNKHLKTFETIDYCGRKIYSNYFPPQATKVGLLLFHNAHAFFQHFLLIAFVSLLWILKMCFSGAGIIYYRILDIKLRKYNFTL